MDKGLYFIKNPEDFQSIPAIFRDEVFEQAEIANFRQADLEKYEASLKVFRDNKATYDYAIERAKETGFETGFGTGKKKRDFEIAKIMKAEGEPIEKIIR